LFSFLFGLHFYRISVRAGTGFSDLQEVEVIELNEPNGWIAIPLKDAQDKYVV
jgi:anaphase-promoting complex subunit 10